MVECGVCTRTHGVFHERGVLEHHGRHGKLSVFVAQFWEVEMQDDGDSVAVRVALGLPAAKRAKTMPSDGGADKTALAPATGASA